MVEKSVSYAIPVENETSGLFRRVQEEMLIKKRIEMSSRIISWLDRAAENMELKDAASRVRSDLENGSILLSISNHLPDKHQIAVKKGKWKVYHRGSMLNYRGKAVIFYVTEDFNPDRLSSDTAATCKLLRETVKADKEAGDPGSPERIVATSLDYFRFFEDSVFAYRKDKSGR
jgi:hypothetical protein